MNETCEVNVAPMATGPDDPRYEPCGAPAHFKFGDTWLCARHYDGLSRSTDDDLACMEDDIAMEDIL